MDRYRSWIILNMLPSIGRVKFTRLIEYFGTADAVLEASRAELMQVRGLEKRQNLTIDSILNWKDQVDADVELRMSPVVQQPLADRL